MTAQNLIDILSQLPPDMVILMETESGDLMSPCFEDSGIESIPIDDDEVESVDIFVIAPCYCGLEDEEEIFTDGVNVDILENVN